jgi:hypothetical protein
MRPPHAIVFMSVVAVALALGGLAPAASGHSLSFARTVSYGTGESPFATAVGDLNGDGKPDLAVSRGPEDGNPGTVGVMLNQGGGTFGVRQDYETGSEPADVAIANLNGDALPDLVTTDSYTGTISLLYNTGGGNFLLARQYEAGYVPTSVAVGDMDGDGAPDLVVANSQTGTVKVFGNYNWDFSGYRTYSTGTRPVSVAVGDLDHDGRQDVVTANVEGGSVSVLINDGSSLEPRQDYGTGSRPLDVAIGDLNGDGGPDLVTADSDSNTVTALLNDGNGRFPGGHAYRVGSTPTSVRIADLNGDGKPDVAVTDSEDGSISVLLNRSDGTLDSERDFRAGDGPISLAVADLNADGRIDLAAANTLRRDGLGLAQQARALRRAGRHREDASRREEDAFALQLPHEGRPALLEARRARTGDRAEARFRRSAPGRREGQAHRQPRPEALAEDVQEHVHLSDPFEAELLEDRPGHRAALGDQRWGAAGDRVIPARPVERPVGAAAAGTLRSRAAIEQEAVLGRR